MTKPAAVAPFAPFEWMLARRYLAATRSGAGVSLISIIAFLGIMLAVATLIIVMSVMQGFRNELLGRILSINGHVFVQTVGPIADYDDLAADIAAVPGVVRAAPVVEGQVMTSAGDYVAGAQVRGVRKADLQSLGIVSQNLIDGSLDDFGTGRNGGDALAVGARLAAELNLRAGDPITLISPRGAATPFGSTPRLKTYRVGAVFSVGISEYDQVFIFMPLEQAQLYFNVRGAAQKIEVMVEDPDRIAAYRDPIAAAADRPVSLLDWQQVNASFFDALKIERNVMRLILSLIVAVAALNIITGLIMLVKDKRGDIAILRSMGATQGAVMRVFFLSGSLIGVLGTATGVALGALFCWNISAIEQFLSNALGTREKEDAHDRALG
ncbi:MAG: lipoprotein-releasing ABC transporter permease subunit, partial [Pseudomonadota bacterium]